MLRPAQLSRHFLDTTLGCCAGPWLARARRRGDGPTVKVGHSRDSRDVDLWAEFELV